MGHVRPVNWVLQAMLVKCELQFSPVTVLCRSGLLTGCCRLACKPAAGLLSACLMMAPCSPHIEYQGGMQTKTRVPQREVRCTLLCWTLWSPPVTYTTHTKTAGRKRRQVRARRAFRQSEVCCLPAPGNVQVLAECSLKKHCSKGDTPGEGGVNDVVVLVLTSSVILLVHIFVRPGSFPAGCGGVRRNQWLPWGGTAQGSTPEAGGGWLRGFHACRKSDAI
jgi:hypothetical protein